MGQEEDGSTGSVTSNTEIDNIAKEVLNKLEKL